MPYPSKKTPEVVEEILARLAGGEMLTPILASDDRYPSREAWDNWIQADEALRLACARAREEGYDQIARDALAIADNPNADAEIAFDKWGKPYVKMNGELVARSKLRVEARLKLLAKWHPSKYGDSAVLTLANKEGETLKIEHRQETQTSVVKLAMLMRSQARLSPEEREALPPPDDGADLV